MRVLLTGGTGFLGKRVAHALARRGHTLRAIARPSSNRADLPPGVEFVPGDTTDADSLRRAALGCDAVMHMAALVKTWVPDTRRFDEVNVGGFRNALAAAKAAGARLVYTSSFIAIGPTGAEPVDESRVHPGRYRNDYERTKALADTEARAAAAAGDDIVMLYPGVVYGPGDVTDGNIVVKLIVDHFAGKVPAVLGPGDRLWSYAFVEDVAEGHALALEKGRRGERYFLAGENVSMNGLFATVERLSGKAAPRWHLPFAAAEAVGLVMWLWAELTGLPPQLTHREVGVFREHWAYASDKATTELGYAPRPLEQGLRETLRWLDERKGR
ncbi:MAG: NAD-dependent epimerase/dehydratase family protein [Vicinamibacteria bacterium]|nr:NAD-dependent epimerase/dehydratase family protein [Vicinamibacteria bacterium]